MRCAVCGESLTEPGYQQISVLTNGSLVVLIVPVNHDEEFDYIYERAKALLEKRLVKEGYSRGTAAPSCIIGD